MVWRQDDSIKDYPGRLLVSKTTINGSTMYSLGGQLSVSVAGLCQQIQLIQIQGKVAGDIHDSLVLLLRTGDSILLII